MLYMDINISLCLLLGDKKMILRMVENNEPHY